MFASYEVATSFPSLTAITGYDLDKSSDVPVMGHNIIQYTCAKYKGKAEVLLGCVRQPLVSEFFWRKVLAAGVQAVEFCGVLWSSVEFCGVLWSSGIWRTSCSGYHWQNIPLSDVLQLTS